MELFRLSQLESYKKVQSVYPDDKSIKFHSGEHMENLNYAFNFVSETSAYKVIRSEKTKFLVVKASKSMLPVVL